MSEHENVISFPRAEKSACPECGSDSISTRYEEETFPYGVGADPINLTAVVPVRSCSKCGVDFTDQEADVARHEAVCAHLGVMPPAEITSIRKRQGLSRGEFARITKVGEASINRWENGYVVQNQAMDNYLYLLSFKENFERVVSRGKDRAKIADRKTASVVSFQRVTLTDDLKKRAANFRL
jgi:putative zinc finger/helix-turn-helix YgiT family protein